MLMDGYSHMMMAFRIQKVAGCSIDYKKKKNWLIYWRKYKQKTKYIQYRPIVETNIVNGNKIASRSMIKLDLNNPTIMKNQYSLQEQSYRESM